MLDKQLLAKSVLTDSTCPLLRGVQSLTYLIQQIIDKG